ncbi:hypothetical protein [Catenulispora rubra]|uniref:hypothetical protein n=1 Tax=Catenulispora rubra TaxID=280293 RepID=UPI001E610831|nr:hypothetical protein [Catenulispora rubra]
MNGAQAVRQVSLVGDAQLPDLGMAGDEHRDQRGLADTGFCMDDHGTAAVPDRARHDGPDRRSLPGVSAERR